MGKYYFKGRRKYNRKRILRLIGVLLLIIGASIVLYVFLPLISWQIYFRPAFASQDITPPIPRANIVDLARNLIDTADYTKAENWFKGYNPKPSQGNQINISSYLLSIPKIQIENALVSTTNSDLEKNLVNYSGTSIPGENGNSVIFGHSTLPQLFDPKDYKTIFANVYKLNNGDLIYAMLNNVTYAYRVFKITIVDPTDSSALSQDYNDSYLTLVTCTPPGTIWKRLVVKARLEKI